MPDDTQDVISGGHLVAKALKAEGVDRIYTLCGGHIIDIYDGCVDEGIEVVDVRHEQVAAHAADATPASPASPAARWSPRDRARPTPSPVSPTPSAPSRPCC